ncbi:hypothetical protein BV25DRAFT_1902896 [Artomyces pyxidatus]|uniref:Uncharacterized protein n=1 Tax=Artomyces pyxidatus TaxID=48021 RepID=A0ACB8SLR7_9AGAM|nr:hypothetical protein BV25DRAFT_1902896 [Artomyces pyxidatus]
MQNLTTPQSCIQAQGYQHLLYGTRLSLNTDSQCVMTETFSPLTIIAAAPGLRGQQYLSAAGMTIMYLDYLFTFPDELEVIWKGPFTQVKCLYVILRYGVGLAQPIFAYALSGLTRQDTPDSVCVTVIFVMATLALLTLTAGNYLMIVRIYTLWDHRKWVLRVVLAGFGICVCLTLGMLIPSVDTILRSVSGARFDNDIFHVCVIGVQPKFWVGIWVSQVAFDVFCLLLTVANAASRPRTVDVRLISDLRRDGLIFYVAIFSLRLLNVVLAAINRVHLFLMAITFVWSMTTVTVCRLVLRVERMIQKVGEDPRRFGHTSFELHFLD